MDEQEWYSKEKIVFEKFKNRLNEVKTFPEAQILIKEAPPENTPGRKYYTHFIFFIDGFHIPYGLNDEEILLYKKFIEKLDSTGQLKYGEGQRIKNNLNNNM